MNRRCNCICGDVSLVLIASLGLSLGFAGESFAQCSNDAGAGNTAENEGCNMDEDNDTTNGGCNSSPPVFTNVAADGGLPRTYCSNTASYNLTQTCVDDAGCPAGDVCNVGTGLCEGPSQPSINRRDTDWYLISQAALMAADTDGNGTVRLQSSVVGEAGLDLVTFFLTFDNVVDCNASVAANIGCYNASGQDGFDLGTNLAEQVFTISENPSGLIVFVAAGLCTGAGIFDGYECSVGVNDYVVTLGTDPVFEDGTFIACGDPEQNPLLGPCNEANPGVGGCEDPDCCKTVCGPDGFNPLCCLDVPLGWIQQCADAAVSIGCAPEVGGPLCMRTGSDNTVDNYLAVCSDPYGSWSADGFGGAGAGDNDWGDDYNPIGAELAAEASFTNGFFFFNPSNSARELLSNIPDWQGAFGPDDTLTRTIIGKGSEFFDDDNNGEIDRLTSTFVITGAGQDLTFDLVQTISQIVPAAGGSEVSVITQTYDIQNNSGAATEFVLVRHLDLDLVWNGSTFSDDSVGTGTNANGKLGLYCFSGEQGGDSGTYITVATSTTGGEYYGSKSGIDPDGDGPGPANGAGTDTQQWDSYGVPIGWENYIPGLGANLDGESGPGPIATPPATGGPGADGSIGISIPISLAGVGPASSAQVVVTTTYGANSPLGAPVAGGEPCPYDCQVVPDGEVGINDFLDLLGQWSQVDSSCDVDGGGVGINDFLGLLANWGPCP